MNERPLDILLPWRESFQEGQAGAVSLCVRDEVSASRFCHRTRVLGKRLESPFPNFHYVPIEQRHRFLLGRNRSAGAGYVHRIRRERPALVEVHNRPNVAAYIAARRPDIPILLYLHNDPRLMKGSRARAQRRALTERCDAIVCVGDYIRECFMDELPAALAEKVHVVHTGVVRPWKSPPAKERLIAYVGLVIPHKGARDFAQAVAKILPRHPDWAVTLVGGWRFGADAPNSTYEFEVRSILAPLGERAHVTGYIPHRAAMAWYAKAAIAVVPSLWQEPLGRSALEALAAGCAVIAARRGGLPEAVEGRGVVLEPTPENLAREIERLIIDDRYRERLQQQAWNDYPFTLEAMAARLDAIKASIMSE